MNEPARKLPLSALGLRAGAGRDIEVTGLSASSAKIKPGNLFAALQGSESHGARFAGDAIDRGAAAVLTDAAGARIARDSLGESGAGMIVVEDPRAGLAHAAARWYGVQPDTVVAITGTNGKTSVASFLRQIWQTLGLRSVNFGTAGVEGDVVTPLSHTTPEPVALHALLRDLWDEGVTHVSMEASSHGLEQKRLDGVRLMAAAFTGLSRDHLDYHRDVESYFRAKAGLFGRVLPEGAVAVVNLDDKRAPDMIKIAKGRGQPTVTYGRAESADMRIGKRRVTATGQEVMLEWRAAGKTGKIDLPLVGAFQAGNAAAAAALAIGCGASEDSVFQALPRLKSVRGRMELVATRGNGASVYVDYAHTPDALRNALESLRPHALGRLLVVFGAGGDRDRGKRAMMGKVAAELSDAAIVTDDNPRSEDPGLIRKEIMQACPGAAEIGDRAEAILVGVDSLQEGDILLVAGKGHETVQEIGGAVYPFDDSEQASVAVAALEGRER